MVMFDLRKTKLGTALLGAAVMDDVVAFVFAKVISVLGSSSSPSSSSSSSSSLGPELGRTLGVTVGLALFLPLFCLYILRPAYGYVAAPHRLAKLQRAYIAGTREDGMAGLTVGMVLVFMALLCAASWGGTSALYGAYLAGLVLSYLGALRSKCTGQGVQSGIEQNVEAEGSRSGSSAGSDAHPDSTDTLQSTLPTGHTGVTASVAKPSSNPAPLTPAHHTTTNLDQSTDQQPGQAENPFEAAFHTYLSPLLFRFLAPLFFASIGYSIPFLSLWRGEIVWKGVVDGLMMVFAKLACGVWVVVGSAYGRGRRQRQKQGQGQGQGKVRMGVRDLGEGGEGRAGGGGIVGSEQERARALGTPMGRRILPGRHGSVISPPGDSAQSPGVMPDQTEASIRASAALASGDDAWAEKGIKGGIVLGLGMVARGEIGLLYVSAFLSPHYYLLSCARVDRHDAVGSAQCGPHGQKVELQ